jgi:Ca2+-binding RTX toxin-like protein
VSISDPWAASNPGSLDLTVTTSSGTIAMPDASGKPVAGSGTAAIEVSGTVAQLNAELAKLTYTAGTASGSVTVDVWDQAGVEAVKSFAVTVKPPVITIPASAASVTETVSGAQIVATSGNHMIFIGGTGDTLTATGGTETVQANLGGNTITTGAGNDTIRFGGSHNVINAGAGNNVLVDSGASNTIVLPAGGHGYDDIQGNVLNNGDRFDLRSMLAATSWKGGSASLAPFVKLTTSGSSAVISVDPTGALTGATYAVGKLEGSGALSLSTLLAHSIT